MAESIGNVRPVAELIVSKRGGIRVAVDKAGAVAGGIINEAYDVTGRHSNIECRDAAPSRFTLFRRLDKLCRVALSFPAAETLRQRVQKERGELFSFLRHPGVPATNNHAEQSMRASVIMRKITFGNRSAQGAQTHSVLASLLHTARRQGRDVRDFLQTLLLSDTATAQAALYNNSS